MQLYIFFLTLLTGTPAFQPGTAVIGEEAEVINLNSSLYYLKNTDQPLDLYEALTLFKNGRFQLNRSVQPLNFGYDPSEYWFYTEFGVEPEKIKVFHIPYPYHQLLDLYANYDNQWHHIKSGNLQPFKTRGSFEPVDFAWPIHFSEGGKIRILVKIKSRSPVIMSAKVRSISNYVKHVNTKDLLYGIFFGILLIMFLYNLFLYIIIKDVAYLYYILIVLMNLAVFSSVSGYAFKYVYPEHPAINFHIRELFIALLIIPTSLFAIAFLDLKKYSLFFYNVLRGMIIIGTFLCISIILGYTFGFSSLIISIHAPLLLCTGIFVWLKGNKAASIYILAWTVYLLGGMAMTLRNTGLLPAVLLTDHSAEVGAVLDVFLLSLALAYRYKRIRNERFRLQRENINLIEQQNLILEEKVRERTKMLNSALRIVQKQHDDIHNKNIEINSSINYALKIQEAIFPSRKKFLSHLKDAMVFYQPKETVSGDFIFFENRGEYLFIAVVDCTGHGVPGALLSMAGYNLFYDAVNVEKLVEPHAILDYVSRNLRLRLNQNDSIIDDGMEVSLCVINKQTRQGKFCGAQRPLLIIDKNKKYNIIRGNKRKIGNYSDNLEKQFYNHCFLLDDVDFIYLYTDGFQDQFGGADEKKYLSKNLVSLLNSISESPGKEQENSLKEEFNKWKGNYEQVDDVLVFGIKP